MKQASHLTTAICDLMQHQTARNKKDFQEESLAICHIREGGFDRDLVYNSNCKRFSGFPSFPGAWMWVFLIPTAGHCYCFCSWC